MSALRQLVITHAGGTRTLELYQVSTRSRSFSATPEVAKGAPRRTRIIGDRRENPSELSVSVYLQQGSFSGSYALAYDVIAECETATRVSYHEGVQVVDGIVSAGVAPDGLGVRMSLSFAPTSATLEPLLTVDTTNYTVDNTILTVDMTVIP